MPPKGTKNINIEISLDTWRKLKIVSISKDIHLQDVVREILDKAVSRKQAVEEIKINE